MRLGFLTAIFSFMLLSGASADTATYVLKQSNNSNKYFVVFAARGDSAAGKSLVGHAFVVWAIEDETTHQSSYIAYGFYPNDETKADLRNEVFGGPVPGKLVNEAIADEHSVSHITDSLVVEVDQKIYENSLKNALLPFGGAIPPHWQAAKTDCVWFLENVALSVLGSIPPRNFYSTILPQDYVKALVKYVETPVTVTTPSYTYTGQAFLRQPNGTGTFKYKSGESFSGLVDLGKPVKGTFTYKDGQTYAGPFNVDSQREGHGVYTWAPGDSFDGTFSKDLPVSGNVKFSDGSAGNVVYSDGLSQKTFTLNWPNGDKLMGQLNNKQMSGTYYWADGTRQSGNIEEGQFVGETDYYKGDGSHYHGLWANGHAQGSGTLYKSDGSQVSGTWSNGDLDLKQVATARDAAGHERSLGEAPGGGSGAGAGAGGGGSVDRVVDGKNVEHHDIPGMTIDVDKGPSDKEPADKEVGGDKDN